MLFPKYFSRTLRQAKIVIQIEHSVKRSFSTNSVEVDSTTYLRLVNETLESLSDRFNDVIEDHELFCGCDTTLSDGVLTVKLSEFGTYVINKQTPNKQIWLSSPYSGPSRYDIESKICDEKESFCWIYKHTGETLHSLLSREIGKIVGSPISFENCYMGANSE